MQFTVLHPDFAFNELVVFGMGSGKEQGQDLLETVSDITLDLEIVPKSINWP
jgi:hypothetical protein